MWEEEDWKFEGLDVETQYLKPTVITSLNENQTILCGHIYEVREMLTDKETREKLWIKEIQKERSNYNKRPSKQEFKLDGQVIVVFDARTNVFKVV